VVHHHTVKIYYEDTDAGGVVYYANYLRYMERARTELLSERGLDVAAYHAKGYLFAVVNIDVQYKKPAALGDVIDVLTEVENITTVTITLHHRISRGEDVLVEANVRLAGIGKDGKPRRLPAEMPVLLAHR
jgi:acyl-CoA thioester hydrolase